MKSTLGLARQALELAQSAVGNLNVQLRNSSLTDWQRAELEKELRFQTNAVLYWSNEFRRLGGAEVMIMPVDNLYAKSKSSEELQAASRQHFEAKKAATKQAEQDAAFREKVNRLRNSQTFLISRCQMLLANSETNAGGASFVHVFGGGSLTKPYDIIRWATITTELGDAEHKWATGKHESAELKLGEASFRLLQAARALDLYESNLGLGAERSEAVIKVTAAIAMTVASGGTTLSIGGAMAVAATGEAALQGTLLTATAVEGKSTISTADLTTAALEVAIAGGSAGLGAYAKRLASGLAPRVLEKVIGRPATDSEIKWAAERIASYIATNAGYWAKRGTGLDKEKDLNWWIIAVTPAVSDLAVELTKEQTVNRTVSEPFKSR